MEFPAVTLCNLNRFKKSKVSLGGKLLENAIENYETILLNQLYGDWNETAYDLENGNKTAEEPKSRRKREAGSPDNSTTSADVTEELTTPGWVTATSSQFTSSNTGNCCFCTNKK